MPINFRISGVDKSLIDLKVRVGGVDKNINHVFQKTAGGDKTIWKRVGLNAWTNRTSPAGVGNLQSVCFGNGYFLACASTTGSGSGSGRYMYSANNGTSWTQIDPGSGVSGAVNWTSICYSPTLRLFCGVGDASSGNSIRCMTIPDTAITGTGTYRPISATRTWNSVCWGGDRFVAVGESGGITWSTNPATWNLVTAYNRPWSQVCWSEDLKLFVAVCNGASASMPSIYTSPDGATWTGRGSYNRAYTSVCCGNGMVVATGNQGADVSSDTITWTNYQIPLLIISMCYSEDKKMFVGGSYSSSGADTGYSSDSKNWTVRATPTSGNAWNSIAYGNGTFCAVSSNGTTANRVITATPLY